MKTFLITEKIFRTNTFFLVDCDYKEANGWFKKRYGMENVLENRDVGGLINVRGNYFRVVWLEKFSLKILPVVVHELLHLVARILQDKGIPIKADFENGDIGDETAAYLLEFYFTEVYRKLKCPTKQSKNTKRSR